MVWGIRLVQNFLARLRSQAESHSQPQPQAQAQTTTTTTTTTNTPAAEINATTSGSHSIQITLNAASLPETLEFKATFTQKRKASEPLEEDGAAPKTKRARQYTSTQTSPQPAAAANAADPTTPGQASTELEELKLGTIRRAAGYTLARADAEGPERDPEEFDQICDAATLDALKDEREEAHFVKTGRILHPDEYVKCAECPANTGIVPYGGEHRMHPMGNPALHFDEEHGVRVMPVVCPTCSIMFRSQEAFRDHDLLVHADVGVEESEAEQADEEDDEEDVVMSDEWSGVTGSPSPASRDARAAREESTHSSASSDPSSFNVNGFGFTVDPIGRVIDHEGNTVGFLPPQAFGNPSRDIPELEQANSSSSSSVEEQHEIGLPDGDATDAVHASPNNIEHTNEAIKEDGDEDAEEQGEQIHRLQNESLSAKVLRSFPGLTKSSARFKQYTAAKTPEYREMSDSEWEAFCEEDRYWRKNHEQQDKDRFVVCAECDGVVRCDDGGASIDTHFSLTHLTNRMKKGRVEPVICQHCHVIYRNFQQRDMHELLLSVKTQHNDGKNEAGKKEYELWLATMKRRSEFGHDSTVFACEDRHFVRHANGQVTDSEDRMCGFLDVE